MTGNLSGGDAGESGEVVDIGVASTDQPGRRRARTRVVVGVLALALIVGGLLVVVRSAESTDDTSVAAISDDETSTPTTPAPTSTLAESTTTSEPGIEVAAPAVEAPAPLPAYTAPSPEPSPPPPPVGTVPPRSYGMDEASDQQRAANQTREPGSLPVPPVGSPYYVLGDGPFRNAAGQKFGGGPMTDPKALGLDFFAAINGTVIIGWNKTGDLDFVPGPTPGSPPLGTRVYDSDGVTVIGYQGFVFTPA